MRTDRALVLIAFSICVFEATVSLITHAVAGETFWVFMHALSIVFWCWFLVDTYHNVVVIHRKEYLEGRYNDCLTIK